MTAPRTLPHGSPCPPSFAHATVADAMSRGMISASPDATAGDVARMMASHHIHAVVVAGVQHQGSSERLRWGVIDARDLVSAALQGRFDDATAGDLAGPPPLLVDPEMPLEQAARAMTDAGVSHAVVVERGQPAGVVSTLAVAVAVVVAWGRG